jgi:hypothetical protein
MHALERRTRGAPVGLESALPRRAAPGAGAAGTARPPSRASLALGSSAWLRGRARHRGAAPLRAVVEVQWRGVKMEGTYLERLFRRLDKLTCGCLGRDELARARLHRPKHARALEPKLGLCQLERAGLTGLDGTFPAG